MHDDSLSADIAVLQHARILFAHRSVGTNILSGVSRLYAQLPGGAPFRILGDTSRYADAYFADALIGENTRPETKCADFVRSFTRFNGGAPDVAMMKFCFVDFGAAMTAPEIFALYTSTIDSLHRLYPAVTFVHVTAPLTARRAGMKEMIKRVIGRGDNFETGNAERSVYNHLLRARYASEPIFDLAAVESARPDGTRETFDSGGARYEALVPGYTDDGGHLNETGQLLAARAMVQTLARAIRSTRHAGAPSFAPH